MMDTAFCTQVIIVTSSSIIIFVSICVDASVWQVRNNTAALDSMLPLTFACAVGDVSCACDALAMARTPSSYRSSLCGAQLLQRQLLCIWQVTQAQRASSS
jgi:hypothetical protein